MRVILFSGGIYHDFDRLAAATAGILATVGIAAEIVTSPAALVAALHRAPADLLVVQALRWRMLGHEKYEPFRAEWAYAVEPDLVAAVTDHARRAGVMALHTGCICFDDWPGWQEILGGGWVWGESFHVPGLEPVAVTMVADHAITARVPPFTVDDEHYRALALHRDATILADGVAGAGDAYPVAWCVDRGGTARAFSLTIGHDLASLATPGQARMIRNAALWLTGREGGSRP